MTRKDLCGSPQADLSDALRTRIYAPSDRDPRHANFTTCIPKALALLAGLTTESVLQWSVEKTLTGWRIIAVAVPRDVAATHRSPGKKRRTT